MKKSELEQLVHASKLELLTDQNSELRRQVQYLKGVNSLLQESLPAMQEQKTQNFRLRLLLNEAEGKAEAQHRRAEEMETRYYHQVTELKKELAQKDNFLQLIQIQHERALFKRDQQIHKLKHVKEQDQSTIRYGQNSFIEMNKSNMTDDGKVRAYMSKDKQQIKIAMKALTNASKSLKAGSMEASMINEISKINRTTYK